MIKNKVVLAIAALLVAVSLVAPVVAQNFSSVQVLNGSAASPSITFLNSSDTGFFRSGSGTIGVSSGGTQVASFGASGLTLGTGGTALTNIQVFSVSVTPASQAANTCAEQAFTVSGVKTTDKIFLGGYTATGNATGYGAARVSAADTVQQTICNPTAGALTPAASTHVYVAIRS